MTLILTRSWPHYVLQVSDRLVTKVSPNGKQSSEHDAEANKTLLVLGNGGAGVLSYTGAAYIQGLPTDQWIAEQITGDPIPRGEKPWASGGECRSIVRGVAATLRLMAERLNTLPTKPLKLQVIAAGYRWTRRDPRRCAPVIAQVGFDPSEGAFASLAIAREWHRELGGWLGDMPKGWLTAAELAALRAEVQVPADVLETALVSAIRSVAQRSDGVGSDCMSVLLSPPAQGVVRVRYVGEGQRVRHLVSAKGVQPIPVGFTPWIIGTRRYFPPAAVTGAYWPIESSPYTIGFDGFPVPPKSASGMSIVGMISGQARRAPSGRIIGEPPQRRPRKPPPA